MDQGSTADISDLFLSEIALENASQEVLGLINSIRILQSRVSARSMTGPQVLDEVAERFPPAVLFSPAIQALPIAYKALRDWLNDRGANLSPHTSRRFFRQLAANLYTEDEDKLAAEEIT